MPLLFSGTNGSLSFCGSRGFRSFRVVGLGGQGCDVLRRFSLGLRMSRAVTFPSDPLRIPVHP